MAYQANRKNSNNDSKNAAQEQRNAQMVQRAADIAQHSANPYVNAAGKAVKVGDKLTGGKVSQAVAKKMNNIPTNRMAKAGMPGDSALSDMLQRNATRQNAPKFQENQENLGGEQEGSSPSSASNKEDNGGKTTGGSKRGGFSNPLKPSSDDKDDKKKDDKKPGESFFSGSLKTKIILGAAIAFLLISSIVILLSSVLNVISDFEDAIGISSFTGRDTGDIDYDTDNKEQKEFFERVNDVELEYLASGKRIDSLKIVAVYHVLVSNGAKIDYDDMTESAIKEIADAMLENGYYDEDTFKNNLINSIFPKYLPDATESVRKQMAEEVINYVDNYYDFINRDPTLDYTDCFGTGTCSYDIKGYYIKGKGNVTENVQLTNLYVRLMQCGKANGHDYGGTFGKPLAGEELVPFETYILGVAYAEIGEGAPAEAVKAQMVAARSYILARHVDMGDWRTLKQEGDKWILQAAACTQDQVFCNPDKGCSGSDAQWGQVYSGQGHNKGFSKKALSQNSPLRTYASQTSGEVLTNSKGNIVYSSYLQTEQQKMISLANQGLDYKQILLQIYNQGSRNYGATNITKAACSGGSSVNCGNTVGDFINWKQAGASWSNVKMGNSGRTIGQIGCLVTSISMLIAKSGVQTSIANFNPGTFVEFLNQNGGFDSSGNLIYAPINKLSSFKYVNQISLSGMTKEQKLNTMKDYQSKGYYMVAEVSPRGEHWVAIDSINGNTVKMLDPATNYTDLWGSGKYTPQSTKTLNLFKVG